MLEVRPTTADGATSASGPELRPDDEVARQIMTAAEAAGHEMPPAIVDFAIDELDAEALLDRVPRPMSRGEWEICTVLVALAGDAEPLTLVEPTAGLDHRRRRTVVHLLDDLAADRDVIVISDDPLFDLLRTWSPMDIEAVRTRLLGSPVRWWIAGGRALELHLGDSWRDHDDTDISVLRTDAEALMALFDDWDVRVAAGGELQPWTGEALDAERSQNNLWLRPRAGGPFVLDVVISDGDDASWRYRRDPWITRPWGEAVLHTDDGYPYLAPELQLLFKSVRPRSKDDADARVAIPRLSIARWNWLAGVLQSEHPWRTLR